MPCSLGVIGTDRSGHSLHHLQVLDIHLEAAGAAARRAPCRDDDRRFLREILDLLEERLGSALLTHALQDAGPVAQQRENDLPGLA